MKAVDRAGSIWGKWDGPREEIGRVSPGLPEPTARPGPDEDRRRAEAADGLGGAISHIPNDDLQASCLALYEAEKAQGTEMPAIIGALQEHIEAEEDRLSREHEEGWRRRQQEERLQKQQRFEAGADSPWIQIDGTEGFHCRRNGRTYRAVRDKDKRWSLFRVKEVGEPGARLGTYQNRRDATKALDKIAFSPEPSW